MPVISVVDAIDVLKEIRLHNNLKMFREAQSNDFCKRYGITPQQFDFLVSVVAVERINEVKLRKK